MSKKKPINPKLYDKRYKVKRTLVETPKGLRAYYYRNGKRIPDAKGRSKWIEQNYQALNKPYSQYQPVLTDKERFSFNNAKAQRGLFTYKGKKIKKVITEILKMTMELSDSDPREITKILDDKGQPRFRNYGELEQLFQEKVNDMSTSSVICTTLLGAAGYRGRRVHTSIFSVLECLTILGVDNWKLMVIDRNGVAHMGKNKGVKAIQEWELSEMQAVEKYSDVAAMQFTYELFYDFTTKTIIIDLSLASGEPMRS